MQRSSPRHRERRYQFLALTILAGVFFGLLVYAAYVKRSQANAETIDLRFLSLEIADSNDERRVGLSNRHWLDPNAGMLFLFERPGIYPFWMKDTRIPLDIIWLDGTRVVDVVTLRAVRDGEAIPPSHTPTRKADRVLEVNAGKAKELGIKPGVTLMLPDFSF